MIIDKSARDLISAWQGLNLSKPPFIMPGDEVLLQDNYCHRYKNLRDYVNDSEFQMLPSFKVHTGLIPIPYAGNILNAEIYILALNPGFAPYDYYAESNDAEFLNRRKNQLRQENLDKDYPWMDLNPKFCWHGGWEYWTSRFGDIITKLAKQKRYSHKDALKELSNKIACLEYFPYHSKSFDIPPKIIRDMASTKLMKAFVDNFVVPKAKKDRATVIVTRHAKGWGLDKSKNIVIYDQADSRAAYLNSKSPGGKAIARKLGIEQDNKKKTSR